MSLLRRGHIYLVYDCFVPNASIKSYDITLKHECESQGYVNRSTAPQRCVLLSVCHSLAECGMVGPILRECVEPTVMFPASQYVTCFTG